MRNPQDSTVVVVEPFWRNAFACVPPEARAFGAVDLRAFGSLSLDDKWTRTLLGLILPAGAEAVALDGRGRGLAILREAAAGRLLLDEQRRGWMREKAVRVSGPQLPFALGRVDDHTTFLARAVGGDGKEHLKALQRLLWFDLVTKRQPGENVLSGYNPPWVRMPLNNWPSRLRNPSNEATGRVDDCSAPVVVVPSSRVEGTSMCRYLPVLLVLLASVPARAAESPRTNFVFILTDNQSAWTLGCYGNEDIRTPSIDNLAKGGTLFTRAFSSNAVCSPTRATLLTGLLPSQHGLHSYLRAGEPQIGPKAHCTIAEFGTLPRILADAGYVCGLSGKWHLGGNEKPQIGFTSWVTTPHGHTTTFYNAEVIDDGKVRKEPTYLTDFWTDRGVRFIEKNKHRPFFLFLAYNGPYGLGASLKVPAKNRHAAYYADRELKSFPREKMHPWQFNNREFLNSPVAIRRYAAEVSGVDDGVGRVLETLTKHGLDERTLVAFTADQGLCGGQHGLWGMGDHTRPLSAFDEMMHVPMIWRQPKTVAAGNKADLLVSNYDFLPTALDYLGLKEKTPTRPTSPGRSYAKALRGEALPWGDAVFYEFENVRVIRTAQWKLVTRFPDGPDELYDLKADPGERTNLIGQAAHAEERKRLARRLDDFFDRYADPKYDLKRGGKSKTPLHTRSAKK